MVIFSETLPNASLVLLLPNEARCHLMQLFVELNSKRKKIWEANKIELVISAFEKALFVGAITREEKHRQREREQCTVRYWERKKIKKNLLLFKTHKRDKLEVSLREILGAISRDFGCYKQKELKYSE